MAADVKGPASYFPSIERPNGRPIVEWLELLDDELAGTAFAIVDGIDGHGPGQGRHHARTECQQRGQQSNAHRAGRRNSVGRAVQRHEEAPFRMTSSLECRIGSARLVVRQ